METMNSSVLYKRTKEYYPIFCDFYGKNSHFINKLLMDMSSTIGCGDKSYRNFEQGTTMTLVDLMGLLGNVPNFTYDECELCVPGMCEDERNSIITHMIDAVGSKYLNLLWKCKTVSEFKNEILKDKKRYFSLTLLIRSKKNDESHTYRVYFSNGYNHADILENLFAIRESIRDNYKDLHKTLEGFAYGDNFVPSTESRSEYKYEIDSGDDTSNDSVYIIELDEKKIHIFDSCNNENSDCETILDGRTNILKDKLSASQVSYWAQQLMGAGWIVSNMNLSNTPEWTDYEDFFKAEVDLIIYALLNTDPVLRDSLLKLDQNHLHIDKLFRYLYEKPKIYRNGGFP